jgi:hypothetical protein
MLDRQRFLAKFSSMTNDQKEDPCLLPAPASEAGRAPGDIQGEYWRWCPRCGHELHNEKCKLRCPRCQYFLSCSDFD